MFSLARSLHSYRRVPSLSEFIPSYLSAGRPPHPLDQPVLPHHQPYVSCNKVVFKGIQGDSFYPSLLHVFCWIHAAKKTPTNTSPIHTYWSFLVLNLSCYVWTVRRIQTVRILFASAAEETLLLYKNRFVQETFLYLFYYLFLSNVFVIVVYALKDSSLSPVQHDAHFHYITCIGTTVQSCGKCPPYSRNQIKSTLFIQP